MNRSSSRRSKGLSTRWQIACGRQSNLDLARGRKISQSKLETLMKAGINLIALLKSIVDPLQRLVIQTCCIAGEPNSPDTQQKVENLPKSESILQRPGC